MSFASDMNAFNAKVRKREAMLYERVTDHIYNSITVGSAVTGAPGQPIDKGDLIKSWKKNPSGNRTMNIVSEGLEPDYSLIIEHNRRGAQLRSKVGGFHSVKLTRLGFRRIVAHELTKVKQATNIRIGQGRSRGGRFTGGIGVEY